VSSDERTEKAFQLGVDNRSALDLNNLNNSSANIKKEDALSIPSVQTPNLGPSLLFARDSQDAYSFFLC